MRQAATLATAALLALTPLTGASAQEAATPLITTQSTQDAGGGVFAGLGATPVATAVAIGVVAAVGIAAASNAANDDDDVASGTSSTSGTGGDDDD